MIDVVDTCVQTEDIIHECELEHVPTTYTDVVTAATMCNEGNSDEHIFDGTTDSDAADDEDDPAATTFDNDDGDSEYASGGELTDTPTERPSTPVI
jgi:hypothetical protein